MSGYRSTNIYYNVRSMRLVKMWRTNLNSTLADEVYNNQDTISRKNNAMHGPTQKRFSEYKKCRCCLYGACGVDMKL